jgi:hypothetical protein
MNVLKKMFECTYVKIHLLQNGKSQRYFITSLKSYKNRKYTCTYIGTQVLKDFTLPIRSLNFKVHMLYMLVQVSSMLPQVIGAVVKSFKCRNRFYHLLTCGQIVKLKNRQKYSQCSSPGTDVTITVFCDFWRKNWRFSQKPMLWSFF